MVSTGRELASVVIEDSGKWHWNGFISIHGQCSVLCRNGHHTPFIATAVYLWVDYEWWQLIRQRTDKPLPWLTGNIHPEKVEEHA